MPEKSVIGNWLFTSTIPTGAFGALENYRTRDSIRAMQDEPSKPEEKLADAADGYTAFENWRYRPIIIKSDHKQMWRSLSDSFFRASFQLLTTIREDLYGEHVEGMAAIFLFRHYLELTLKKIILNGRWLARADVNAKGPVQPVSKSMN